jgi:SAM-dependent methyltransferase
MTDVRGRKDEVRDQTIKDFGQQWTIYTQNNGYYGSVELLKDIIEPLLPLEQLRDTTAAEIGSGTGRLVNMMMQAGVDRLYALEPSKAVESLKKNVSRYSDRVEILNMRGDQLPQLDLDLVISIGVIHHIPDPDPVMSAAYAALKPGGRILLWLYGREGNELYLSILGPLRTITRRLPHFLLVPIAHFLSFGAGLYLSLARIMPLPMRGYVINIFGRFDRQTRFLAVYDQLNPNYAKYYTRAEAIDLLNRAGFTNVQAFHRHAYSWTVLGTRPLTSALSDFSSDEQAF